MILDATTRKLTVTLGGAVATAQSPVVVDWVDIDTTTMTPGTTPSLTNSATPVDILAAPAASHQRKVNSITLVNADTAAITATFKLNDNGTLYALFACTLGVGEKAVYTDALGWQTFDANGAAKVVASGSGVWVGTQVKTSGTTLTTGPRTTTIFARLQAGGGGGGGCTSVASAAAGAGGGGAGGYAEKTFTVTPNTAYTYAIGGAGAGNSGAAGGNGGDTTLTVGGVTVTAKGGTGGPQAVAANALKTFAGGAGGVVSTNGDVNGAGEPGSYGVTLVVAGPVVAGGAGGSSDFGSGGVGIVAAGAGVAAAGFGAGGGGSATGASAARAGGAGTAGILIVDEYA